MTRTTFALRLLTLVLGMLCLGSTPSAAQTTCIVDSTLDTNASVPPVTGSLRDCMTRARSGDTITFDSNVFDLTNSDAATTINVVGPLPVMAEGNVTIDASDRRVTINGSAAGSAVGIDIMSSGNVLRGLSIIGFTQSGIRITDGSSNTIGGSRSSGSGPNGQGLRISACGSFGVEIGGAAASGNTVKGCWIGLDASGLSPQENYAGVSIAGGAHGNTIGSVISGEANVISGNQFEGITLADAGTDNNVVIGNVIGTTGPIDEPIPGRTSTSGNGSSGVFLSRGTKNTQIGGTNAGEPNVIAFNGGGGIVIDGSDTSQNSARGNRISRNHRGGIALFDNANNGRRPAKSHCVQVVSQSGGLFTLAGKGTAPVAGTVELFSDAGDQGQTFLGRIDTAAGPWEMTVVASEVLNVSATLTDALGNTSRFGVFGLTEDDTDDDGVSDEIEALAGTDDADPLETPANPGTLTITKMSVKLTFTGGGKDSIKITVSPSLPTGFTPDGPTLGIAIGGHTEQFTLDAKGKASTENSKASFKTSTMNGPVVKYGIKRASLQAAIESLGLEEKTTTDDGETWVIPVVVTLGSSMWVGTTTVVYKATTGKTGKAKH